MHKSFMLLMLFFAAYLLVACGWGGNATGADAPSQIRTPHPTFTPTPDTAALAVQATQALTTTEPTTEPVSTLTETTQLSMPVTPPTPPDASPTAADEPTATQAPKPAAKAIVNTPLVNMRSGPSTDFPVVVIVDRGYELDIVGKNDKGDWWKVCCVEDKSGWIDIELVDTEGNVDGVPVVKAEVAQAAPTNTPAPADTATDTAADTPTPTPADATATVASSTTTTTTTSADSAFDLIVQEQFPETKLVRIFLYVYNHDNTALDGYSILVTKDGAPVPVGNATSAKQPGFTWPVADVRQRFQNLKVELPGVAPAGTWTVQLSKDGKAVGPAATFTLKNNEPNQELYVRYERQ